jgi:DNA repair protein RecO (recombination protein O)
MTTVEGIVLKERSVGEQDKFIDILTGESGVIEVSVKGARKINGKSGSSTQLLAYSRFCIDKRGKYLYLNSAEPIHIFYGLRNSLSKISLASYFAEIMRFCIKPEAQNGDIMRLLLNTLYYLENGKRDEKQLKSVFELRLMSEIGYMPDIVACRSCGVYEPAELYFCMESGGFYCADCFDNESSDNYMKIKLPVLSALRHIVLADLSRLFNFRVSEEVQQKLSALTEIYALTHLERSFGTLDFYKTIV